MENFLSRNTGLSFWLCCLICISTDCWKSIGFAHCLVRFEPLSIPMVGCRAKGLDLLPHILISREVFQNAYF